MKGMSVAIVANVDVFVQVWYSGNIQPEQIMVKDTAVDDNLLQLNSYSSA